MQQRFLDRALDPVESSQMSDSPLVQAEYEELLQFLDNEFRPDNLRDQTGIVGTSMAVVDPVDGWASAGNELSPARASFELTHSNLVGIFGTGSDYAEFAHNTETHPLTTFNVDFVPDWNPMESDHRPSSAASSNHGHSPNQSPTSDTSSDVDGSPLQFFTDCFEPNSTKHPNCSPAPPLSSLNPSAFPSPAVQNASVHPSPAISQALLFTCNVCWKTYKTKNNLQRHKRDALHGPATPSPLFANTSPFITSSGYSTPMIPLFPDKKLYECPHPDCNRKGDNGFPRKDNMMQHQRLVHNTNLPKRQRQKRGQKSGIAKR